MTGKPQERSLISDMIHLFEEGGHYTTDELTAELFKTRQFTHRYAYLKRQVEQVRAGLKKGTKRVSIPPMNLQKLEDKDGVKRWRLING